ncbi:hypothetical protein D5085_04060 [Ectothiorhodospiraceae bacterium BW-2]|nr:hypothetical protein D5085_04060 [Ectothiorhodospiraceae bacterium BW-2]
MPRYPLALLCLLLTAPLLAEPLWVSEPNYNSALNGASSCISQTQAPTPALAEQMAATYARRELMQSLETTLNASFEQMVTATGKVASAEVKRAVKDHIHIQTQGVLRGSRIAEKWYDSRNQQVCVWVVIEQNRYQALNTLPTNLNL